MLKQLARNQKMYAVELFKDLHSLKLEERLTLN